MPTRISISDAPLADLTDEESLFNIPMAQINKTGKVTPARTTIAALTDHIRQPAVPFNRDIARFRPFEGAGRALPLPGNTPPGTAAITAQIAFNEARKRILSGDGNQYTALDGIVQVRDSGVYHANLQLHGSMLLTVPVGDWIWQCKVIIHWGNTISTNESCIIHPVERNTNIDLMYGQATHTDQITGGQDIEVELELFNVGTGNSPPFGSETIQLGSSVDGDFSSLTITRMND